MKIVTFDLEIYRAILNGQDEADFQEQYPGVEYVRTFQDFDRMGIACVCAISTAHKLPLIYDRHNVQEFQRELDDADLIVSYNGLAFDNAVLAASGITVPLDRQHDLLAVIRQSCGQRYSLDAMAQKNLGLSKTGNGAHAPIKWQQGKHAEVIGYCLNDAMMTHELFLLTEKQGYLLTPRGQQVPLVRYERSGNLF